MNWKTILSGIAIGAATGYFLNQSIKKSAYLSADTVLKNVKSAFKQHGPVDGSWIQMTVEDYDQEPIKSKVYRGGITWRKEGERQQYEFIADAITSTLIDIRPLS